MAHVCPWWLAYTFDNPLRRLIHRPETILGPHVRPGQVVADFGCGMGYFGIALARLVGPQGRVYAVDLQERMLSILMARAARAGVAARILPRLVRAGELAVTEPLDFALAFWMLHEVPAPRPFLTEIRQLLKKGGRLLVVEPRGHVGPAVFEDEIALAVSAGFEVLDRPAVALSRGVLLG
ncbi:MAG: methyltransferase domain-containing protein [Thermodesulfobacteriota bacterium]